MVALEPFTLQCGQWLVYFEKGPAIVRYQEAEQKESNFDRKRPPQLARDGAWPILPPGAWSSIAALMTLPHGQHLDCPCPCPVGLVGTEPWCQPSVPHRETCKGQVLHCR